MQAADVTVDAHDLRQLESALETFTILARLDQEYADDVVLVLQRIADDARAQLFSVGADNMSVERYLQIQEAVVAAELES